MKQDKRKSRSRSFVVDDEPPARRNLRALLMGLADVELVKECGNERDAVSTIRTIEPALFIQTCSPIEEAMGLTANTFTLAA